MGAGTTVGQRDEHEHGQQEPAQPGGQGAAADPRVAGNPQQRPKPGHHQPDVLLTQQGQPQPDGHRSPALSIRGQGGQAEEAGGQGLGVEVPDRGPLQRRERQIGGGDGQTSMGAVQPPCPDQIDADGRDGQADGL